MLLRADSHQVAGDVDELLSNRDVSLSDEHAGVMHRVGKLSLGNDGLEASLHHLGQGKTKHVIELSLILLEETESNHSSDKGITYIIIKILNNEYSSTLEDSSLIFLVQSQKISGGLSTNSKYTR